MDKKGVGLAIATVAIIGILLGQSAIFTLSNNIVPINS